MPLEAGTFSVYPGYAGPLVVKGSVCVGQEGTGTQVLSFGLRGTDPACGAGNRSDAANACGLHIHAGTSCRDALGHYYSSSLSEDPWNPVGYETLAGRASGQNLRVATGLGLEEVTGRVVVVHDATGARVACSPLATMPDVAGASLLVASVSKSYEGALSVQGSAVIHQVGFDYAAGQVIDFNLTGADPTCGTVNITGVANACGIHVHEGRSCENVSQAGGHFWDTLVYAVDPWMLVQYTAPAGVATGVTAPVVSGEDHGSILGRVLIVHDAAGARIACGQICFGEAARHGDAGVTPSTAPAVRPPGPSFALGVLALVLTG